MKRMSTASMSMSLWQPISVLPSQLPFRGSHLSSPEMHLVAAILEDAWHCVLRNLDARRGRRRHEFTDAHEWFFDDRRDWPFACANVCDLLMLDMRAVRDSLQEAIARRKAGQPELETPVLPLEEPRRRNPVSRDSNQPRDDQSNDRERFEVVVWDEA